MASIHDVLTASTPTLSKATSDLLTRYGEAVESLGIELEGQIGEEAFWEVSMAANSGGWLAHGGYTVWAAGGTRTVYIYALKGGTRPRASLKVRQ